MRLVGAVVIVSLIIATCWAIVSAVPSAPLPPQTKQDHCFNPALSMFWPCDEIDRYEWV